MVYRIPVIIPRLADFVELSSDYFLVAECIMSDVAFLSVPLVVEEINP